MKKLEKNWITAPIIDTEYKQYLLLAYLHGIRNSYNELKLYPHLAELISQYSELLLLRDNKLALADRFPKALNGIDLNEMKMIFDKQITEENWVEEISNIIEMAIPYVKNSIQEGKDLYEELERNIHVEPVGIAPLKNNEGYFILNATGFRETLVYQYRVSLYESVDDKFRSIYTHYTASFVKSLSVTNTFIKSEMIKQFPDISNPAVFAFDSNFAIPVEDTYLPIIKRIVAKMVDV